jgi:hypothetical protein
MRRSFPFFVPLFVLVQIAALAGTPTIIDVDWENACGGSNIRVTRVDGRIVSINAEVEHYWEGRQWVCHFVDGKIVSALYRHFTVTRKAAPEREAAFTTEQHDDLIKAFHFPDHKLTGMENTLMEDLQDVIAKATAKG